MRTSLEILMMATALPAGAQARPADGSVVAAQASGATTPDPADTSSIVLDTIAKHLFGCLPEATAEGESAPYFAESYEASDAGSGIIFPGRPTASTGSLGATPGPA